MDLKSHCLFEGPPLLTAQREAAGFEANAQGLGRRNKVADPLCKLNLKETCEFNLKETCEFVEAFPPGALHTQTSRGELVEIPAPPTPGRPIFRFTTSAAAAAAAAAGNNNNINVSFSSSASRKNAPSKWDDAEKWLYNTLDSPSHQHQQGFKLLGPSSNQRNAYKPTQVVFAHKSGVTQVKKVSKAISTFRVHHDSVKSLDATPSSTHVLLMQDKFTHKVEQISRNLRCPEPTRDGFVFGNLTNESTKEATLEAVHEVIKHRDIGTEMTPLGSSTTSRCRTPFKTPSPARHNTPADRSGPLVSPNSSSTINIAQFQKCCLAKLQLGMQYDSVTSNWSSRQEEEEEISKSLRHFEISNDGSISVSESRACVWEEEKTKCCLRYQREEAKIQAWVNLQNAKAEAQSRKLEVKIQKMKSNMEEKLMKKMGIVHRNAEELRSAARLQHTEQIKRATEESRKTLKLQNSHTSSSSCFHTCSNH